MKYKIKYIWTCRRQHQSRGSFLDLPQRCTFNDWSFMSILNHVLLYLVMICHNLNHSYSHGFNQHFTLSSSIASVITTIISPTRPCHRSQAQYPLQPLWTKECKGLMMMLLMKILKCSDGCSPGDDTQLHRASGQGESRHLWWSPWSLCVRDTSPRLPLGHQGRPQSSLWWRWSSCPTLLDRGYSRHWGF